MMNPHARVFLGMHIQAREQADTQEEGERYLAAGVFSCKSDRSMWQNMTAYLATRYPNRCFCSLLRLYTGTVFRKDDGVSVLVQPHVWGAHQTLTPLGPATLVTYDVDGDFQAHTTQPRFCVNNDASQAGSQDASLFDVIQTHVRINAISKDVTGDDGQGLFLNLFGFSARTKAEDIAHGYCEMQKRSDKEQGRPRYTFYVSQLTAGSSDLEVLQKVVARTNAVVTIHQVSSLSLTVKSVPLESDALLTRPFLHTPQPRDSGQGSCGGLPQDLGYPT